MAGAHDARRAMSHLLRRSSASDADALWRFGSPRPLPGAGFNSTFFSGGAASPLARPRLRARRRLRSPPVLGSPLLLRFEPLLSSFLGLEELPFVSPLPDRRISVFDLPPALARLSSFFWLWFGRIALAVSGRLKDNLAVSSPKTKSRFCLKNSRS